MINFAHTIRAEFPKRKVVIVGDLVADQFLHGTISRVSREAPVFILRHDETETLAGGAANAAANVASLGGQAVLVGFVGKDSNGEILLNQLKSANVICDFVVASPKVKTTTKVRVIAGQTYTPRQQVIRIDYENSNEIEADLEETLIKNLFSACENADAIIISDYKYGVASPKIIETVQKISIEKNIPLIADSRFRLKNFQGATSATPNQEEVEEILGKNFTENDCVKLCQEFRFKSLLVTCGNKGMLLIENGKMPLRLQAVGAKEPVDVTGAGDTVIATYTLGLASGMSFAESAKLANHAGGIVVMKKGTAAVGVEELIQSLSKNETIEQKAKTQ